MANGGWGSGSWGGSSWGSGQQEPDISEEVTLSEELTVDLPLKLLTASTLSPFFVELTFSYDLDPAFGPHTDTANYSLTPPLTVIGAVVTSPRTIRLQTLEQSPSVYTLTMSQGRSIVGDELSPLFDTANFGFAIFFATAQSDTKVMLTFSAPMLVDADFTDPVNYEIQDFNGGLVPILSVVGQGAAPVSRATLELGASLTKGGYYVARVGPAVTTLTGGLNMVPATNVFHWVGSATNVGPLVIPIANFSGEVSSGLLGQPAGLVYFSPALDATIANSTIEVDSVELCTRAFDTYEFPQPLDPPALFTFSPRGPVSALGAGMILWTPAERIGLARVNLATTHTEPMPATQDGPCNATLVGPGGTTNINLQP